MVLALALALALALPRDVVAKVLNKHRFFPLTIFLQQQQQQQGKEAQAQLIRICKHTPGRQEGRPIGSWPAHSSTHSLSGFLPLNNILCLSFIALPKLLNFSSGHYISPVRLFASFNLPASFSKLESQLKYVFLICHTPSAPSNSPRVTVVGKSRVCFDLIYANGCIDIALLPPPCPFLN